MIFHFAVALEVEMRLPSNVEFRVGASSRAANWAGDQQSLAATERRGHGIEEAAVGLIAS